MILLKGKCVRDSIIDSVKDYIDIGRDKIGIMLATENKSAVVYANSQIKMFKKYGILVDYFNPNTSVKEENIINKISEWNKNDNIHGIMILTPMYKHIDRNHIIDKIDDIKDIEGIKKINLGKLMIGEYAPYPPTAVAAIEILKFYNITVEGKNVVIAGRSVIVGKPLTMLLLRYNKMGNATVTVCHSKTENINEVIGRADIFFSAIGKPGFFKTSKLKNNAICIDIGINVVKENGKTKIVGDILPDELEHLYAYTPVPGGVGTVTNAILLKNYVESKRRKDIHCK